MQIRDLFRDTIDRNIKGVITVGKEDDAQIEQELREYVVTRELDKHFRSFLAAYNKATTEKTDRVGVWISGFFGSGKSHYLKILSYLLRNPMIEGRPALDYFRDKFDDPTVYAELQRAITAAQATVIIFNIDAKSSTDAKSDKDAIVKVLLNVFNGSLGYSPRHPAVADLERSLDRAGTFDAFKAKYSELSGGITWDGTDGRHEGRDTFDFDHGLIVKALVESGAKASAKEAEIAHQAASTKRHEISIEQFSELVRQYIDGKGTKHRIVFLIDEVGQYIGGNTKLMLNLQTVAEEFGKAMAGRGWLLVTAQEAIDTIIKDIKGEDFSKIQGRFATRLTLSSSNADEVIRRRLLTKTPVARDTLKALYHEKAAILRNALTFHANVEPKTYRDDDDFVACYPFVPYQFGLMQKVFEQIRRMGETGKHLSEGERSLLSAFQEAAKSVADQPLGALVPLHRFYDSLETFLDSSIRRVFSEARENNRLQENPRCIDVLKILFMIKHVKEVPKTLENVVTLSLGQIDADKIALKKEVVDALDRLVHQTLVQKSGDEFIFLTNDEQDVRRSIKGIGLHRTDRELVEQLAKKAFDTIFGEKTGPKFRFRNSRDFQIDQRFDGVPFGKLGHSMCLHILSPDGDGYDDDAHVRAMKHMGGGLVIFRLPAGGYAEDALYVEKVRKFLLNAKPSSQSEQAKRAVSDIRDELPKIEQRMQVELERAIEDADVFIEGTPAKVAGKGAREKMTAALQQLAETVYTKFDLIDVPAKKDDDVRQILHFDDLQALIGAGWAPNKQAMDEVERYLQRQAAKTKRVTLKDLLDEFTGKPYGWNDLDVQAIVARHLVAETVQARKEGAVLERRDPNLASSLVKTRDTDKLVIELKTHTDRSVLDKAKKVLKELTGRSAWPDKESAFFDDARTALRSLSSELDALKGRYAVRTYPGQQKVENASKAVAALLSEHEAAILFGQIKAREADLLDTAEDLSRVKSFFSGLVLPWDAAMDVVARCEPARTFLDSDAQQSLDRIAEIAAMPAPYDKVKELPALADRITKAYDKVLDRERKAANDAIAQNLGTAKEFLETDGFDAVEAKDLLRPLTNLTEALAASNDINQIVALTARLGGAYNAVLDEAVRRKALKLPKGAPGAPPPPEKKIRRVRLADLAGQPKPLRSPEDVDAFADALRDRLKAELEDNDEVRLT